MTPEHPDWLGLREEDLTDVEREACAALSPEVRSERERALAMGRIVHRLPIPSNGPRLEAVLAAARVPVHRGGPTRAWRAGTTGLAVAAAAAAAAVVVVAAQGEGERDRGGGGVASVHLEAVAEGPSGIRPLEPGAEVEAEEKVVFRLHTDGPGWLELRESGTRIWPEKGPTEVGEGSHGPGGDLPLAWRPENPGVKRYEAWLCPEPGAAPSRCRIDVMGLAW